MSLAESGPDSDEGRDEGGIRCVSCGRPSGVCSAFVEYSPGNIKLRRCAAAECGSILDKYVEYEPLLIAFDVIMLHPGAYRHILFNRPQKPRRIIGLFMYVLLLEFYHRMYYLDDNLDPDVLLSAACWSFGSSIVSSIIAWMVAKWGSEHELWTCPSVSLLIKAIALGGAIKTLFVLMSIWNYPKNFLLVLRTLSFLCTGVGLQVILVGAAPWQAFALAAIVALTQAIGFGGGFVF